MSETERRKAETWSLAGLALAIYFAQDPVVHDFLIDWQRRDDEGHSFAVLLYSGRFRSKAADEIRIASLPAGNTAHAVAAAKGLALSGTDTALAALVANLGRRDFALLTIVEAIAPMASGPNHIWIVSSTSARNSKRMLQMRTICGLWIPGASNRSPRRSRISLHSSKMQPATDLFAVGCQARRNPPAPLGATLVGARRWPWSHGARMRSILDRARRARRGGTSPSPTVACREAHQRGVVVTLTTAFAFAAFLCLLFAGSALRAQTSEETKSNSWDAAWAELFRREAPDFADFQNDEEARAIALEGHRQRRPGSAGAYPPPDRVHRDDGFDAGHDAWHPRRLCQSPATSPC